MIRDSVNQEISFTEALSYLVEGVKLALSKECRVFVIIPILINILVMGTGGYFMFQLIFNFLSSYIEALPEWLAFLSYVIWLVLFLTIGFVFCYIFSTVATIIASPFYGLLAEKVEKLILGAPFAAENNDGLSAVLKDVPRVVGRELRKLAYYLPRVLLCLLITCIPVVNVIAPLLWFLLAAWMMCIQYVDYAYDNHKTSFQDMLYELKQHRFVAFLFGAIVALLMTIPLLNLVIPSASVCAGTRFYVEMQRRFTLSQVQAN